MAEAMLRFLEPVASAVGFQNVDVMREAVHKRAGQALAAQHLRPLFERQVGRHDQARSLIGCHGSVKTGHGGLRAHRPC